MQIWPAVWLKIESIDIPRKNVVEGLLVSLLGDVWQGHVYPLRGRGYLCTA